MATTDTLYDGWRRLDEDLNVLRWRAERLIELGYGHRDADRLAATQVDIHELDRLIGLGCPRDTAVRIAA